MSLCKRSGGTWWVDFYTPNGERIRRTTGTKSKAEAQEYHDRRVRRIGQVVLNVRTPPHLPGGLEVVTHFVHAEHEFGRQSLVARVVGFAHGAEIFAFIEDVAAVRDVERAEQMHEGAFAGAGAAFDGQEFAADFPDASGASGSIQAAAQQRDTS